MKKEEIVSRINNLEIKFDGLKDTMTVFQDNINNNISWFYAVLGIFIALIGVVGVALYFLVQTAVNKGIEKGIEKTHGKIEEQIKNSKQYGWSIGKSLVINGQFQVHLNELNSQGLLFFDVKDKNGLSLEKIIKVNNDGLITVTVPQMRNGGQAEWATMWVLSKYWKKE